MRVRALREDPQAYGARAEQEAEYDEAHWRATIAKDAWILVSIDQVDIAIAGMARAMPEAVRDRCGDPRGAWMFGCWVDPASRGRRIAGLLLQAGERVAAEWGLPRVGLGVFTTNVIARRSYERLGLRPLGDPIPSTGRPGAFYQAMVRELATST